MIEKLGIAGGFVLFLLIAVGVAIDSNSTESQFLYQGKPGLETALSHVFYGLNFAVMVVLLSVVGLIAVVFILALATGGILLAFDRVIKPINAIDAKI